MPSPGKNRVKVSENLGATAIALVAPVDTSLIIIDLPFERLWKILIFSVKNIGALWTQKKNGLDKEFQAKL